VVDGEVVVHDSEACHLWRNPNCTTRVRVKRRALESQAAHRQKHDMEAQDGIRCAALFSALDAYPLLSTTCPGSPFTTQSFSPLSEQTKLKGGKTKPNQTKPKGGEEDKALHEEKAEKLARCGRLRRMCGISAPPTQEEEVGVFCATNLRSKAFPQDWARRRRTASSLDCRTEQFFAG